MIRQLVEEFLFKVLRERPEETDLSSVRVDSTRDPAHGDLALNAAMVFAKQWKRPPREIAEELAPLFRSSPLISAVEIAGPGFINFRIAPAAYQELLREILAQSSAFGTRPAEEPRREQIEFVSANPTGPVNVVSARAAAVGDTLARLFEAIGIEAEREFYVNDHGNQVDHLLDSVLYYLNGEKGDFPENGYRGDYVSEIANEARDGILALLAEGAEDPDAGRLATLRDAIPALVAGDRGPWESASPGGDSAVPVTAASRRALLRLWVLERMLAWQRSDLEAFGVRFQSWFRESSLHAGNDIGDTYAALEKSGDVFENDGAHWFRSTNYGDEADRVLIRSNGQPTYFLADIAYHRTKAERKYDHAIDILGPDHHGHIPRMLGAMRALGRPEDWLEILIVQQVNLLKDGQPVKMSKRAGDFIALRELIDEVGTDAARFFFVMLKPNSHLNFDLDLAKSKSLENPVYYVQYAHARVCSVLRHAEAAGIEPGAHEEADLSLLTETDDLSLLKNLDRYPDTVEAAAHAREPQRIPTYLKELASEFHGYYHKVKVVTDDRPLTLARLALLEGTRIVLQNGLALLAVDAPDAM
ncbi:MAG: arginine--tRNA ligase [Gemmatimonadetes bacterium]|nr:arginine--tRNA ligase [Gemmatimonadota bacterium]